MPEPVVPLGLLYVMASVPAHHETRLWDLCFEDDPERTIIRRLSEFAPDLVAVGMRNIQNNDYSGGEANLAYYRDILNTVREHTAAPIVVGGGGFSVMPGALMEHLRPDFGISGEGEAGFARLLEVLESGNGGLETIPNLHYFGEDGLVSVPSAGTFQDLDVLPRPDRGLVDPRYYAVSGTDAIQTKRGCPMRCTYCTYPQIEGRTVRARDPEQVVDELFAAKKAHAEVRHFFIVDSVFNVQPEHARAVCRTMIARGVDVSWTCYASPVGFDRELADLMVEAGCAGIEVGSDSGSDEVLDRLQKGFGVAQIVDLHQHCSAAGLPDCHSFILGTPGETLEDVRRTLDFCKELDPPAAILMIWTDDEEALQEDAPAGRAAFRESIEALVRARCEELPRWIVPSIGFNFDVRVLAALRRGGVVGPLWRCLP
jgi:radical SAM superfamily enzyme YgiQ (UPF0313 family)